MTLPVDLNSLHVPAAGNVPPIAWMQAIHSNFHALLGPPAVAVTRAGVSVPHNTAVIPTFVDTADGINTDGMFNVANADRVTAQTAGVYLAIVDVEPEVGTDTGSWALRLQLNGVTIFTRVKQAFGGLALGLASYIPRFLALNPGDYVRMSVSQTSGVTSSALCRMSLWRVSSLAPSAAFSYADLDGVHRAAFNKQAPHTWGAQVRTNFESLANRPVCVLTKSGTQSVPHETATSILFDGELTDAFDMHSNTVENQRIEFKRAGVYLILGNATYETNTTDIRLLALFTPFRTIYQTEIFMPVGGVPTSMVITSMARVSVGDIVQLETQQRSGGSLAIQNDAQLGVVWLGD